MAAAKKAKADKDKMRFITPVFRVSYPHLFKPQGDDEGKKKYSITMLFPKDTDLTDIKRAMKNAKIAEFGPDKDEWPDKLRSPVTDGDDESNDEREGYKGHWVIKATSVEQSKPGLVDKDGEPILNASDFYPGCYARAYIFARVWTYMGKQGVQFILDHVQKVKDGKSFGGKKPIDQVFGPMDEEGDDDADFT